MGVKIDGMKKIKIQIVDLYGKLILATENLLKKHYEIEYSEEPDFVFYSVYRTGREHYKYKNCVKIFIGLEGVIPDFNECDYAMGSYPMDVGERYLQTPYQGLEPDMFERERFKKINIKERKFCNFIYSNDNNGKGAILRQEFCKELMKYKKVDCPGRVLNNMTDAIEARDGNWYQGKLEFIKDYKFTIAFENISMPGMITEKLIQAFQVGTIPIYWGDPEVGKMFNTKAFINCHDYNSWEEIIERIKEVDNDDEKYREMLLENPVLDSYKKDYAKVSEEFIVGIIEKGNNPYEKDPLGWESGIKAVEELQQMETSIWYKIYTLQRKIEKGVKKVIAFVKDKRNE